MRDVESSLDRPHKELRGFGRVHLGKGKSGSVEIPLHGRAFSFWDPSAHGWVAEAGEFELLVGFSEADIRTRSSVIWEG